MASQGNKRANERTNERIVCAWNARRPSALAAAAARDRVESIQSGCGRRRRRQVGRTAPVAAAVPVEGSSGRRRRRSHSRYSARFGLHTTEEFGRLCNALDWSAARSISSGGGSALNCTAQSAAQCVPFARRRWTPSSRSQRGRAARTHLLRSRPRWRRPPIKRRKI